MKISVYDPSLKDTHPKDIASRIVTLLLWLGYLWICKDIFRLLPEPISLIVPGNAFMDPDATKGVLMFMLKLTVIAYFISVSFFIWRFFVETYLRTRLVKVRELEQDKVGKTFGLQVEDLKQFQVAKRVEVDVQSDGTIELCSRGARNE